MILQRSSEAMTSCPVTIKKPRYEDGNEYFKQLTVRLSPSFLLLILQPASHPVPPVPADWIASPVAPISPCWALTAASAWRPALPAPTRPTTHTVAVSTAAHDVQPQRKVDIFNLCFL